MSTSHEQKTQELLERLKEIQDTLPILQEHKEEWEELERRFTALHDRFSTARKNHPDALHSHEIRHMKEEFDALQGEIRKFHDRVEKDISKLQTS